MLITVKHILDICPHANPKIAAALPAALNHWLPIYGVTSKRAVQIFLAEAAEETDGFRTLREYASGAAYEGRKDLGNTHPGDGMRFHGGGVFMITGRANYERTGREIGLDLLNHPELLQIVDVAVHAACQFWNDHHLTALAKAGNLDPVTHVINGGYNGNATRHLYDDRAKLVITADLDIPAHVTTQGPIPPQVPPKIPAKPAAVVPPVAAPVPEHVSPSYPLPPSVPNPGPVAPKRSFSLITWLENLVLAYEAWKPAAVGNRQSLIGDTVMNKNTLNIATLVGIAGLVGAVLPTILSLYGTNGLIGAAVFTVCFLCQAFMPVGTVHAVESTALQAIPAVEAIDPALKPLLEDVKSALQAALVAPVAPLPTQGTVTVGVTG